MMDAAACFEGEHDFSAYRAAGCESAHARRRVLSCRVFSGEDGVLVIEVTATAFVKNMVRIMAGTLLEIGGGRLPSGTVQEALASGSRNAAGPTAPPHGLYLHKVYYGKIPDIGLVWPVFVQAG
jgi:tRNA pseudouridine38-40 synthase